MNVIIMRGVPGSGKSTYIKTNYPNASICSADDYFQRDGKYKFAQDLLGAAHAECIRKFIALCINDCSEDAYVIVDNTNIFTHDIAPYYQVAGAFKHNVRIITLDIEPCIAAARNVHEVSISKVLSMYDNMNRETKRFPKRWVHSIIK